jgi:hypothetical protein
MAISETTKRSLIVLAIPGSSFRWTPPCFWNPLLALGSTPAWSANKRDETAGIETSNLSELDKTFRNKNHLLSKSIQMHEILLRCSSTDLTSGWLSKIGNIN